MFMTATAGAGNPFEVKNRFAGFGVCADFGQLAHPPGAAIGTVAVEIPYFYFV